MSQKSSSSYKCNTQIKKYVEKKTSLRAYLGVILPSKKPKVIYPIFRLHAKNRKNAMHRFVCTLKKTHFGPPLQDFPLKKYVRQF